MTSKWCREKGVVVAVYAEKPAGQGGRRLHLHHHHHHYHHIDQNVTRKDGRGRGYNRKAELLDYSRHLRTPDASHPQSHSKQLPTIEVLAADGKRMQKHSSSQNCFNKCIGFEVTRFLRSIEGKRSHKKKKKKSLVKNLKVQKSGSLFTKLLRSLQKRR